MIWMQLVVSCYFCLQRNVHLLRPFVCNRSSADLFVYTVYICIGCVHVFHYIGHVVT